VLLRECLQSGQTETAILVQPFGNISDDVAKAVKKDVPSSKWPVYKDYCIETDSESGESYVAAYISLFEPVAGQDAGQGTKTYRGREPEQAAIHNYTPLGKPELIVELANWADDAITPESALSWAEIYGLLAPSTVQRAADGLPGLAFIESVSDFARAAGEVRTCLRTYEALKREEDWTLEELSSEVSPLPADVIKPWERKQGHERAWLFGVLGRMTQTRLLEHCYPRLNIYTRGGYPTGKFMLSWGFNSLLGAIWLQMAWLLELWGDPSSVRFCRLQDCRRVITFEPGKPSYEVSNPKRGEYKTRSDRVFCKGRACKQKYNYRKKAGWPTYV
jgi:hypothetical protein